MKETNKSLRKGFSPWLIIVGLLLAAVAGAYIGPRIGNTTFPAIEANLKEDIKNIRAVVEQHMRNNNGTVKDLTWGKLISDKVIKGSFANNVFAADLSSAPASLFSDVYAPKYVESAGGTVGDIKIWIVPATSDATEEKFNIIVDVSGLTEMSDKLEESLFSYTKILVGDDQVNGGTVDAVAAPGATTTAISTGVAIGTADGRVAFTFE